MVVILVHGRVGDDVEAVGLEERRGAPLDVRPDRDGVGPEVVDIRAAGTGLGDARFRKHQVVVCDLRPEVDLEHEVLAVVVKEVSRDAHALAHPVDPDAAPVLAPVNVIVGDEGVHRAVQLDAGGFAAAVLVVLPDLVDFIAANLRERAPQASDDARLPAMLDVVVPDQVVADVPALPSEFFHRDGNGAAIVLGVVELIAVLSERHARAGGVLDRVVFDDPTLGPVGADEADLLGGRRGPRRGSLLECEAAHGDEIPPGLARVEHRLPHIDFDLLFVRIHSFELGHEGCVFVIHLGEPKTWIVFVHGRLRNGFENQEDFLRSREGRLDRCPEALEMGPLRRDRDQKFAQQSPVHRSLADFDNSPAIWRSSLQDQFPALLAEIHRVELQPVAILQPPEAGLTTGHFDDSSIAALLRALHGHHGLLALHLEGENVHQFLWALVRRVLTKDNGFARGLPQPVAIQIHGPGVVFLPSFIPIAFDEVAEGIEFSEKRIRQGQLPRIALEFFPTGDDLRSLDHDLLPGSRLKDDRLALDSSARRIDLLAVGARVHGDRVARLGLVRSGLDCFQRTARGPIVRVMARRRDMDFCSLAGHVGAGGANDRCNVCSILWVFAI